MNKIHFHIISLFLLYSACSEVYGTQTKTEKHANSNPFLNIKHLHYNFPDIPEASYQILTKKLSTLLEKKIFKQKFTTPEEIEIWLTTMLLKKGFWNPTINIKKKFEENKPNNIDIEITIPLQRVFNSINLNLSGYSKRKIPRLERKIALGEPCDCQIIEKWINLVREHLNSAGYWNSKVYTQINEKEQDGYKLKTDLTINVVAGNQIKFGKISVSTNQKSNPHCVEKFLLFREGDFWNSAKIRKSKQKLHSLGVFKNIQIICHEKENLKENIPIHINLETDTRFEAKTSVKASLMGQNKDNFLGLYTKPKFEYEGCFISKGIFDIADKVVSSLKCNPETQSLGLCYQNLNPSFSNYPIAVDSLLAKEKILTEDSQHEQVFINSGLQINLSKKIINDAKIGIGFGGEAFKQQPQTAKQICKWATYIFYEPNLQWDKLSGRWFNRNGATCFLGCKLMWPYESFHSQILRVFGESAIFLPIVNQLCCVIKAKYCSNHFFMYSDQQLMPISEEVFNKDLASTTVKSTNNLHLFPDLSDDGLEKSPSFDLIHICQKGHHLSSSLDTELRLLLKKNLGISLFHNSCIERTKKTSFNFLTGVGIRYHTPVSTICFDIGWNYNKKSLTWRIALGEPF